MEGEEREDGRRGKGGWEKREWEKRGGEGEGRQGQDICCESDCKLVSDAAKDRVYVTKIRAR